jgi:hypothetical protein
LIGRSIFFRIFLLTICSSAIEFPIIYAIFSPAGQWYTAFIQILFWLPGFMMINHFKDPLVSKLIFPLVIFLSMISNYMVNGSWNSFFCYNIYCFLCNPFEFTFGKDTGYLLINFYLLFCIWLCNIITEYRSNAFIFTCFNKLKMLIGVGCLLINVFIGLKYLVLSIISFMNIYTTLTYLFIALVFFLLGLMVEIRRIS